MGSRTRRGRQHFDRLVEDIVSKPDVGSLLPVSVFRLRQAVCSDISDQRQPIGSSPATRFADVEPRRAYGAFSAYLTAGAGVRSVADLPELRAAMQFLLSESGWAPDDAARLLVAIFSFTHFQVLAEANRWASFLASNLPDDHTLLPHVAGAAALGAWFEGDLDEAIRMGARCLPD